MQSPDFHSLRKGEKQKDASRPKFALDGPQMPLDFIKTSSDNLKVPQADTDTKNDEKVKLVSKETK